MEGNMLKSFYLLLLGAILANSVYAQEDTTETFRPNIRLLLMGSVTQPFSAKKNDQAFEHGSFSLGEHVEVNYTSFFADDAGLMTGLRFGGVWVEHFPENVETRTFEYWLDVPLRFYVLNHGKSDWWFNIGVGGYYSALMNQWAYPKPGLELPPGYKESLPAFAYGRWGLTADLSCGLPVRKGMQFVIGFLVYMDLGTLHVADDATITSSISTASFYLGLQF